MNEHDRDLLNAWDHIAIKFVNQQKTKYGFWDFFERKFFEY